MGRYLRCAIACLVALGISGMALGLVAPAPARTQASLTAIAPVRSCGALSGLDLAPAVGATVTITSAVASQAGKASFCRVRGTVAPAIGFEVDLPIARWTQRLLQLGCGGLCGHIDIAIPQAGNCAPALNGEFVVAASDLGHEDVPGQPLGTWASDPQKRIDFAYRANHVTSLVAKALTRAFYGRGPRFSYFAGCSDGGREAMMEAERYPNDFDGVSAGAPVMNFQVQNSFYHAWLVTSNLRADGSPILLADKLASLHKAVLTHCDTLDGIADGLLSDPRACRVDPSWIACVPGSNAGQCLTPDEMAVVQKIYEGPRDAAGDRFMPGGPQPGSELQWDFIPDRAGAPSMSALLGGAMMTHMILPVSDGSAADLRNFAFDRANFARVTELHALNDATNPDLSRFAGRGGKLIMWHGWSDTSVSPMISIAYYKEVERRIGTAATNRFYRLFLLPGTGHCGGGDGYSQIDTLTPLMAWVERGEAPGQIVAGKIPDRPKGPPGGRPGPATKTADPLPTPDQVATEIRPIFPFPAVPKLASSAIGGRRYVPGASSVREPDKIDWYGAKLIAPGFQRDFKVVAGRLTVAPLRGN